MKLKNTVLVLLLFPLLLVGCGSGRHPTNVVSNADVFPSDFKYSEIQDETLNAAESGDVSTAQFFVQNYVANIYPESGMPDKDLVLQKIRSNSAQNIIMIEKALASRGYQKVAPEEANCVISICYGEGNKDGRVGAPKIPARFKIGFLNISCDLLGEGSKSTCAWQMMVQIKKKAALESEFKRAVDAAKEDIPKSPEEVAREAAKRQHSFFF